MGGFTEDETRELSPERRADVYKAVAGEMELGLGVRLSQESWSVTAWSYKQQSMVRECQELRGSGKLRVGREAMWRGLWSDDGLDCNGSCTGSSEVSGTPRKVFSFSVLILHIKYKL